MKKRISKIRALWQRLTEKARLSFSISLSLPPFFKVEARYSAEIEKKAVNDNHTKRSWRRRAAQKRFCRR